MPPGYRAIGELGRGGLGVVVLARHESLDRLCAVKRIGATAGAGSDAVARFRREAKALARLDHPAIVRLYDVVTFGGSLFLVMEYVEGEDLRRLLDADDVDPMLTRVALLDVAGALGHAGSQGIVHRDVKPANVFVSSDGHAKLGDFGIARMVADTAAFRTALGVTVGTPAYMAPEQILGDAGIGAPADVYGFSVMAYEVTVGRLPFDAAGLEATIDAHLHAEPQHPSETLNGYPSTAADALLAGMDKDPSQRPSIREVGEALASVPVSQWPTPHRPRLRRHRASVTLDPTSVSTVGEPSGVVAGSREPDTSTPRVGEPSPVVGWVEPQVYRPRRRHRRWGWALAILPVVVVAGWLAVRSSGSGTAGTLRIRSVSVGIPPKQRSAGCPTTTFVFRGRVGTNGQPGRVRLRWTGPDGVTRPPLTATAGAGSDALSAVLRFTVDGKRTLRGAATLRVLQPSIATGVGPEVIYSCG